jgi:2-polyprenyl-6-methoxyphenol hydroxylase-like FAD-dependent oxidoreductase
VRVVVVGAGPGGLCLAQRLRATGVDVVVLERDGSAATRAQGYRVSLKETGAEALRACLPAELFDLAVATSLRLPTRMIFMDDRLEPRFGKPIPPVPPGPAGFGVNRATLREILLTGVDVRFGARFTHYGPGVRVHVDGLPPLAADLLVGADGTGSAVRHQLLPDAGVDDLGWAVYGRTPLTDDLLERLPAELLYTFNRVMAADGTALSVVTCRTQVPVPEAVRRHAPHARLTDVPPYLSWTLTWPGAAPTGTPEQLHARAVDALAGWLPPVREVVELAEPGATFRCDITSARPVGGWDEPGVTLLGDAVHTMSPGRGDGANVALRDARLLGDLLAGAVARGTPVTDAAARYQQQMLEYGFAAVEASRTHPFAPMQRR